MQCPAPYCQPAAAPLLNHDPLGLGVHPTPFVLRRNGNHAFAGGQRRREVIERAVVANDRNLLAIHHDARALLRLAFYFDHMSVLDKGSSSSAKLTASLPRAMIVNP